MTDDDGAVVSTIKYYPFGLTREQSGTLPTDKLFTGQQKEPDDVLELYHYNARIYSAAMGRFLSVDPVWGDGQLLNGYSYVMNNPLAYTDPSEMCLPGINCPGDTSEEESKTECFLVTCNPADPNTVLVTTEPDGTSAPHRADEPPPSSDPPPSSGPQPVAEELPLCPGPSCSSESGSSSACASCAEAAGTTVVLLGVATGCEAVTATLCPGWEAYAIGGAAYACYETNCVTKAVEVVGGLIDFAVKKVKPDAEADGAPHSGFKTDEDGKVTGYTEFDENGQAVKTFRGVGKPHAEQLPPIIYEPKAPGGKLTETRTPTPAELPAGY